MNRKKIDGAAPDDVECEPRDRSESLAQGDIFEWLPKDSADPWRQYGIIVTADCDVAHYKHRGVLSYCPILNLLDFLELFWLPDELKRQRRAHLKALSALIHKYQLRYAPEYTGRVDQHLISPWLSRRGPEGIAEDLGVSNPDHLSNLLLNLRLLKDLDAVRERGEAKRIVAAIAEVRSGPGVGNRKKRTKVVQSIWKNLASRAKNPPSDLFFINRLDDERRCGFMVYLRRIGELQESAIAVSPESELYSGRVCARRIGRLKPPFRYGLTQRLGGIFSSIGLPAAYEQACEISVARLAKRLGFLISEEKGNERD